MNLKICSLLLLFMPCVVQAGMPFVGMYQTIDDKTNNPKSIVAVYEYKQDTTQMVAGRVVALYDTEGVISETLSKPVRIAEKVEGKPFIVGTDVIWSMKWDDKKSQYTGGKIMDPASGSIYSSVIWQDNPETLNVRGKIGPFGRTQTWHPLKESDIPKELKNIKTDSWKPVIR